MKAPALDNVKPLLSPLAPFFTAMIALVYVNPAIDAIPPGDCTDQSSPTPIRITTGQRDFPRADHHKSACGIGAFELQF
jgi:hypothetical protein